MIIIVNNFHLIKSCMFFSLSCVLSTHTTSPKGPFLGTSITVGVAGLVLTYTQQITGLMNWAVRMACEVESRMTCVERNGEYAGLAPEVKEMEMEVKDILERR